ncbi:twin-arginine translocation pathway signal sequence domain protein [Glaciecola sp. KUL10]|nr:twin-arginine translocation pathway signal sequence domain protein [Glaciecola sp. KUL10]
MSAGVPDSAIAAWSPDDNIDNTSDPRVRALSWAILAPNPHNRQPWLIELQGEHDVVVRIDSQRLLIHTDPFSRQILIGTGAMLGLMDIAAKQFGFNTETIWFEEGRFDRNSIDSKPVARVRFTRSNEKPNNDLFSYITRRRTVRSNYDINSPPSKILESALLSLDTNTINNRIIVKQPHIHLFDSVKRIAKEAWKIELTTPETYLENAQLLRVGSMEIAKHRDGISITSPLLVAFERFGLFDRDRFPPLESNIIKTQLKAFNETIDATPSFFVMTSFDNTRITQLMAGKTYVRAHLMATKYGFVMHPISQALQEFPEMSQLYSDIKQILISETFSSESTVQMLCRIGKPANGQAFPKPSPRRGLEAYYV